MFKGNSKANLVFLTCAVVYGMFMPDLDWDVLYNEKGVSLLLKENTPGKAALAYVGMTVVENTPPRAILDILSFTNVKNVTVTEKC
jgi:hypothetical protein